MQIGFTIVDWRLASGSPETRPWLCRAQLHLIKAADLRVGAEQEVVSVMAGVVLEGGVEEVAGANSLEEASPPEEASEAGGADPALS